MRAAIFWVLLAAGMASAQVPESARRSEAQALAASEGCISCHSAVASP